MSDWRDDLRDTARYMDQATDDVETTGVCMEEYDSFGYPEEQREAIGRAMDRWDNGLADLKQAVTELEKIAEEAP